MRSAIILASTLFAVGPTFAAYNLIKDYSGANFFDGWQFYGNYDNLTNGDVVYLDQTNATQGSPKLAYTTDKGTAIIRVDNETVVPYNEKRNSIRIATTDFFPISSVFLFDAVHMAYGCSVWPSFWTSGANWPAAGEIDILEAVNLMPANQMAIHSANGCTINGANCTDGAGCTVGEKKPNSYGDNFSNAGGGLWATQFETTGINIWFWSRADIPASITSATNSIDVSDWGTPSASYSTSSTCDIGKLFGPQQLILDITLCGDWAGVPSVYTPSCGGDGSANACYINSVINEGKAYNDAWLEMNYVKVFATSDDTFTASLSGTSTVLLSANAGPTSSSASSASSAATTTKGSNSTNSSPNTGGGSGAAAASPRMYLAFAAGTALSVFTWMLL
ncbi:concanavalin A-like lectin/glucanase domain-containing protein [Epithele typhae]|uniref:concanavalin A-like lectin/glucanase domain-containing protein n=1 Tax=Epithele typhae TaxID=378194 RepID=UPI0020074390|nr:concanavalin A-like lectin/glucanase domain-containing protein [Epithele typhae]KAH9940488.1 concanavalin A-like lectin/glucanase domain-containing protein [Epithele typhae]